MFASVLTSVGASMLAVCGGVAWLSPALSLQAVGLMDCKDKSALVNVRAMGCWQLCASTVLIAGLNGCDFAAGVGLVAAAVASLMVVVPWEALGRPVGPQVPGILIFTTLGVLTLTSAISPWVAAVIYLLLGCLIYVSPVETAKLYMLTEPMSNLAYSILSVAGGHIAMTGIYLAALAGSMSQPVCFAVTFGVNAGIVLKWALLDASAFDARSFRPLVWVAISALLAGGSLQLEQRAS